jgi:hypothetical protein
LPTFSQSCVGVLMRTVSPTAVALVICLKNDEISTHKPGDFRFLRDIEALIGSSPTGINQVFVVAIFEDCPVNRPTIAIWDNDTSYSKVCGEFMKYRRKNWTITNRNSSMSSPKCLYPNSPGYGDVDYRGGRMSQRYSNCGEKISEKPTPQG